MPLTFARIDQKLIHGQVTAAWIPYLSIEEIIVVDQDLTEDDFTQAIMASGLPPEVKSIFFTNPAKLSTFMENHDSKRTMVLFRDVVCAKESIECGLSLSFLNLGNQAYLPNTESIKLTQCFFADRQDFTTLCLLAEEGIDLFFQSVPTARRIPFNPASYRWPK
ncbi:MAG: PTS sugar transporter subunit IIB [Deltaproteobacteria bacterium]|nr:PTS sugar transporter subunit IIB [Deltaproteobacteria bacterium]